MIRHLYIRNYALIEELDLDFSSGLTIITGETGAGKSILLGALGLVMGNRAETRVLFREDEKCVVEGVFHIGKYQLAPFFEENDLDYDDELVIRREISPSGKSRAFVNDSPVNLKVLQALSAELIDLHQQFDTLDINDMSFQLKMVDALAGNRERLERYREEYRHYRADKKRLAELEAREAAARKEAEFLEFQLNEFREAALDADEQQVLEEQLNVLNNAEEIKKTLGAAFNHLLESEQSVVGQLQELSIALNQIGDFDQRLGQIRERFNGLVVELEDLGQEMERVGDSVEIDPRRAEEIQERLDLIYRLQTKHTVNSVQGLLDIQAQLDRQLQEFADQTEEIAQLTQRIESREAVLIKQAEQLSEARKSAVPTFEAQVMQLLGELAMEHARFKAEFSIIHDLGPNGWDEVRFFFSANKGGKLLEIKDVASGGELSRLALVTKSLVASAIPLPTLIFDEIDTGISGDVALKMGRILRKLSNEHQVVSITHSPQVASKANRHYFVFKEIRDDRTLTRVRPLTGDDRVRSIAVMLSQDPPSASAMQNARELLENG